MEIKDSLKVKGRTAIVDDELVEGALGCTFKGNFKNARTIGR